MSIQTRAVEVGTERVKLPTTGLTGPGLNPVRISTMVQNNGPAAVYIGGGDVTTTGETKGIKVENGSVLNDVIIRSSDDLYAISAAEGNEVVIFEST